MIKISQFITTMRAVATNVDNPMMHKWLYGTSELIREQDERIIRLCKYPGMIPDELLIAYAEVLAGTLEREQKLDSFVVSNNNAMYDVRKIITRLEIIHFATKGNYKEQEIINVCQRIQNAIAYEDVNKRNRS